MKNFIKLISTAIFCMCILSACGVGGSKKQKVVQDNLLTNTKVSAISMKEEFSSSYRKILSYKTDDYSKLSIASFNHTILPEDGDLSGLLADYSNVIASITEDDDNYEFIKVSFGSSLNELYCEQVGDVVSTLDYVRKVARPIEPLNEEEKEKFITDPAYSFMFSTFYSLQYDILSQESLTVGKRDQALEDFHSEFESYVDKLSEEELMASDIKEKITNNARKIAERFSTEKIKLTCTIDSIEVHNAGEDSQY